MTHRRIAALRALAERPGTEDEGRTAQAKLEHYQRTAPPPQPQILTFEDAYREVMQRWAQKIRDEEWRAHVARLDRLELEAIRKYNQDRLSWWGTVRRFIRGGGR